jgi:undecaprenyl-diphosphatase
MAIPIITLAGLLETHGALREGASVDWAAVAVGTLVSGACAFACIHLFLRLVERVGMVPFVIYRLALGAGLLLLAI